MKKSKHPARLSKVADASAKNTTKTTKITQAAKRWQTDVKTRIKEVESAAQAITDKQKDINAAIDTYTDICRNIVDLEYKWDNETEAKKKKKFEVEHAKDNKTADAIIKDLNGRHNKELEGLTENLVSVSTIEAVKW